MAGAVALGLVPLGTPAFAADPQPPVLSPAQGNGDLVGAFSDQAQEVSHPLYLPVVRAGDGLRGTMMSAGILDPIGADTVPGV